MLPLSKLSVLFSFVLWAALATAQNNLGALLDAGATRLSAEDFRKQLVQRAIVGPTPAGLMLELIYTVNGIVEGSGTLAMGASTPSSRARVSGEWKIDENARICTSMKFSYVGGGSSIIGAGGGYLPPRCQYWYKLGDKYFLSDSDTDRSAKVLSRTIKP
jgi:hypothetical protein